MGTRTTLKFNVTIASLKNAVTIKEFTIIFWEELGIDEPQDNFKLIDKQCQHIVLRLQLHQTWRKEMFYLTTHSTHFIYGYMASDIW